jgi:hypothetical protein
MQRYGRVLHGLHESAKLGRVDLEEAVGQFDRTALNLDRLAAVEAEILELIPEGINFAGSTANGRRHADLCRRFDVLAAALPAIDGFRITARPPPIDTIAQVRMDAAEIGEPEAWVRAEEMVNEPSSEIDDYRFRLAMARRGLVRERLREIVHKVDALLAPLEPPPTSEGQPHDTWARDLAEWADGFNWDALASRIAEIRRLLDGGSFGEARWGDLARHLRFAEPVDLRDILASDWPSVREDVERQLYREDEPVPVDVDDLATLAVSNPTGGVTTALDWSALDDEGFERLVFNLFGGTDGYENPQWLTRTRAPDRGRDLSADRVVGDALSGTRRERIMVQCRHRPTSSVSPGDAQEARTKAELWTNPPFDVIVIATTGRFTTDAVAWIESNNISNRLRIEMWPESHLEMLLADRPELVQRFGLRA